jgi:protein tyrosine phosphatase (PTP) superfamily phosphohydrolase (DUF442 family)
MLSYLGLRTHPWQWALGGRSSHPLTSPRNDIPGVANFARVSPALWRGAQPTREGFAALQRMGVRTVVNLRELHDDRALMAGLGLGYARLPFNPTEPSDALVSQFLQIVADPANQPVFVHCQAGADRTGTLVVAYRVMVQGWPVSEAVKEMPRFGFHNLWTDLLRYLDDLRPVPPGPVASPAPVVERVP